MNDPLGLGKPRYTLFNRSCRFEKNWKIRKFRTKYIFLSSERVAHNTFFWKFSVKGGRGKKHTPPPLDRVSPCIPPDQCLKESREKKAGSRLFISSFWSKWLACLTREELSLEQIWSCVCAFKHVKSHKLWAFDTIDAMTLQKNSGNWKEECFKNIPKYLEYATPN